VNVNELLSLSANSNTSGLALVYVHAAAAGKQAKATNMAIATPAEMIPRLFTSSAPSDLLTNLWVVKKALDGLRPS
jgi:hypothetical protein